MHWEKSYVVMDKLHVLRILQANEALEPAVSTSHRKFWTWIMSPLKFLKSLTKTHNRKTEHERPRDHTLTNLNE